PVSGGTIDVMSRRVSVGGPLRYALWPPAFMLGIVAEWIGRPELVLLDAVTGFVLLGLGLAAWALRPRWRVGPILGIAGILACDSGLRRRAMPASRCGHPLPFCFRQLDD